ncbi:BON domain-containing protein [Roseateles sp.]|uniref:BON domain-containing protein n=1 Tax=Roseateles sp. TaxID=1971397 RepID=UPI002E06A24A|nr:BON domain-containing protein [Roseateles sp.]
MKTDSQLQRDVIEELGWEPSVHAARIGVEVRDGIVTLAGQVDSYAEKLNAERAAQRVAGVRAMTTELEVRLPEPSRRSDTDIAAAVQNALEWSFSLAVSRRIHVMVANGWVTLSGDVDWQFQRQAAVDTVRPMMGVAGIDNQIRIKPSPSAALVRADVESALGRAAIAAPGEISVAIEGSEVMLSGTVRSWAERETATNAAWNTPGVTQVVDRMTITH